MCSIWVIYTLYFILYIVDGWINTYSWVCLGTGWRAVDILYLIWCAPFVVVVVLGKIDNWQFPFVSLEGKEGRRGDYAFSSTIFNWNLLRADRKVIHFHADAKKSITWICLVLVLLFSFGNSLKANRTLRYTIYMLYRYVGFFNLTTLVLVCLPVGRNLSIFAQMFSWRLSRQIYFHIVVQVRQVSVNWLRAQFDLVRSSRWWSWWWLIESVLSSFYLFLLLFVWHSLERQRGITRIM